MWIFKKTQCGAFSQPLARIRALLAHFWRKTAPRALKFAPCAESHLQPRFRALTVSKRGRSSPSYCVVSHPRAANLSTRQLGPACSVRVDLSCQPGIRIHPINWNITHSKVPGVPFYGLHRPEPSSRLVVSIFAGFSGPEPPKGRPPYIYIIIDSQRLANTLVQSESL